VGASVTFEPKQITVEPGAAATIHVKVQNTGQVVDQFLIDVVGDAAPWAKAEPPTLSLLPGREGTAVITIVPPRDARTGAGERPLGIRVQSHEDPEGSVVEEGTISLGAFAETTAELLPRNSRGHRRARHEVAVDNRGNAPLQVSITAGDPDKLLAFRVVPEQLVVAPGNAGFAHVRVRARKLFWTGPPRQAPFHVVVQPAGQAPITVEGAFVQAGILAGWVLPALGAAAALALVAAGLWFLVLKPAVQSAAKAAVAQPLAEQSSAIADIKKQGGGTTPPGGGTATPGATPGPGGGDGPLGKPFNKRLVLGTTSSTYEVPDKATLSVTDMIFQNPLAQKGTLTVKRNGDTLLVVSLENFRDLDYHFVAPLTFNAKDKLVVDFNCGAGCNAAVFVNGYQKGP
jgi:hypothetical protein